MNPVELVRRFLVDLWRLPFFFKFALMWMAGAAVWQLWKRQLHANVMAASVAWPTYNARVVWAQVSDRKSRGEDGPSYWDGLLTYSYTVPGCDLEVGEYRKKFSDPEEAEDWAQALRDTSIEVRVDPTDARRSVWEETAIRTVTRAESPVFDRAQPVTMEFWGIRSLASWILFCASALGAALALWMQLTSLAGKPVITPEGNFGAFFAMQIGAIVCGALSSVIAAKHRIPGARRQWSDFMKIENGSLMKALGAYFGVVFLYAWVRMGANDGAPGKWGTLMFSAGWLLCYVPAALSSWQQIRRREGALAEDR